MIVEQDRPFCGIGAEVSYRIQKEIFDQLDAPILRVAQKTLPCLQRTAGASGVAGAEKVDRRREEGLLRLTTCCHA